MVVIRSASAADAAQIAMVRRDSWFAAYEGIISHGIIDRVTAPDGGAGVRQSFLTRPWQRMIAAVAVSPPESPPPKSPPPKSPPPAPQPPAPQPPKSRPGASGQAPGIVGYASFGPELDVLGAPWPYPLSAEGRAGRAAELYALYVRPAWWSTGTGRALTERVLTTVSAAGYRCVTLWVLEDNARARRFYERAGFAPDGARHLLDDLGGVIEIRYRRALSG